MPQEIKFVVILFSCPNSENSGTFEYRDAIEVEQTAETESVVVPITTLQRMIFYSVPKFLISEHKMKNLASAAQITYVAYRFCD